MAAKYWEIKDKTYARVFEFKASRTRLLYKNL
jgi:hypothetical protein